MTARADAAPTAAYQGEPGAYSEAAARALVPDHATRGFRTFADVFDALEIGEADVAVVPVENSAFGPIVPVVEALEVRAVRVVQEAWRPIRHALLALPGTRIESVREVRSHVQALGQCRATLARIVPGAAVVEAHDTAGAARVIAEGQLVGVAAVASAHAAEAYGLAVLADGIEDEANNRTRFLVVVRADPAGAESLGGRAS